MTKKIYSKNIICETKCFHILLAFSLITTALLTAASIYCYLIKYKAKQKHLLPLHITITNLKSFALIIIHYKMKSCMYLLKEIDIKNCICYYFNNTMRFFILMIFY